MPVLTIPELKALWVNGFIPDENNYIDLFDTMNSLAGSDGADGQSAYEIAVSQGFVGTVGDWLQSLQGSDGADGQDALPLTLLKPSEFSQLTTSEKIALNEDYKIIPETEPTGYLVTIFDGNTDIDSQNQNSVSINLQNAELLSFFDYSISSDGGGNAITGFGVVSSENQSINGIDLTSLPDGNITVSIYLTNISGQGSTVTAQATKQVAAPAIQHYENRAGAASPDSATSVGGWVAGNGISQSSTLQSRTGSTSLRIASNTEGTNQFRYFDFSSGSSGQTDFLGGENTTITGWIYAPNGANAEIQLTGSDLGRLDIPFTPDTWTQFTFNAVITSSGNLYFYTDSAVGIFIDDLRIESAQAPQVNTPPVANFSANNVSIEEGNSVTFTDLSTNNPDSWEWNFEGADVVTSNEQNPTVNYLVAGTYGVTLTVSNEDGSDAEVKTNYITVTDPNVVTPPTPVNKTPENPSATPPNITETYTPSSSADLANSLNANKIAVISNSFDATGITFASGQIIRPNGGQISGSNINISDAFIEENTLSAFSSSASFSSLYDKSRLRPETFGGVSDSAIDALIRNSKFATGTALQVYIKNQESTYTRSGDFNWNMNGSIVRTTSSANLSHGSGTNNQTTYMMDFNGTNPIIFNGEFDGQDLASRMIHVNGCEKYLFDNLNVHNYYAPPNAYARGIAFRFAIENNFSEGYFGNSTVENVGAASNGNANDAPFGVSKAFLVSHKSNNVSHLYFENVTINNIYGDDAEGFINSGNASGSQYTNLGSQCQVTFENCTFRACQRRALKINASNVTVNNCLIESATNDWIFSGAQATLVHVFSIKSAEPINNVTVTNNTIRVLGDARNSAFSITDATNCLIENNVMEANYIMAQRSIGFANSTTQGGLYNGDLSNTVIFRNNTITNFYIFFGNVYLPINGGPVITGNIQNLDVDRNLGLYWAAFRLTATSGEMPDGFTIQNHTINVNQTFNTGVLFGGVFNTQGIEPKNMEFNNVNINYSGGSLPTHPFAYLGKNDTQSDFDNTNSIIDCNITGASGTGAINVLGADDGVVITNSVGDGNTPITTV